MSINVNYYGAESSWITFKPNASLTDTFMVASGNSVEQSTYGLSSRTWLAGLIAQNINDRYYQPIDKSYGWCATDGTAPFDNVYYLTGYNNNHGRYEANKHGYSTMGLQINGSRLPYITSDHAQYYKSSKTGGVVWDHAPINYNPGTQFTFAPKDTMYDNGFKYVGVAQGSIAPVLKFDFSTIFYTPIISYYLLKPGYTIADWDNVADPLSYDALVESTVTRDVKSFYDYVAADETLIDRIVIYNVRLIAQHINWKSDGTYSDRTTGSDTNSTGVIAPLAMSDATATLNFDDWYTTDNPDNYTVNIDMSCVDNYTRQPGTIRGYNERTQISTTYTYNTICARTISGIPIQSGRGYNQPSTYPYNITPVCYDDGKYTIKRWESDTSLTQAQRHYVTVYTTIAAFGTLDNFIEYCRKCAAYTGGYFSDCIEPAWTHDLNQPTCYLGTIDMAGITHGQYTSGTANDDQPQKTWGDEWSEKTPYDPNKPSPTDENDKGDLTSHLNSGSYVTSAKYYATTEQQITRLIDFMNTYAPTDTELTADFKGVNPSDYITNILYFPFDVMYSGPSSQIYLSVLNTTANGLKFSPSYGVTIADFGGISIERYFNDFRDFSPYTKLSLNIPFATTVELDIGEYYGHTLNIKSAIDFTTGDILTLIIRDGLVTKTVSGNCAIQLPLSALAMGTYQQTLNTLQSNAKINEMQSIANDVLTLTNTGVGVVGAAMSSGATALLSNPINTLVSGTTQRDVLTEQAGQIDYTIKHTTPTPISLSGGTPCNMAMLEYIPRYTITRCKSLNVIDYNTFGNTVGFATVQQGRVSDFNGLIVCSDVEFDSISATATEQDVIKNFLKSGVII